MCIWRKLTSKPIKQISVRMIMMKQSFDNIVGKEKMLN